MSEPLVCCVMLVNGRPEMVRRAVESFRTQSYKNRWLFILDSGKTHVNGSLRQDLSGLLFHYFQWRNGQSIGALRNDAINEACAEIDNPMPIPEIIAHWDSDDWSHPQRLAEQVDLLQSSGADCVGYSSALFWHEERREAWIYTHLTRFDVVGASLCYWRKTWERVPFQDTNQGEDVAFWKRVNSRGVSGIGNSAPLGYGTPIVNDGDPRIICAIHAGSATKGTPVQNSPQWRRAPMHDEYCREKMRLEGKA